MGHEHQPKAKIMKALAKVERGREPGPKGKDPFDTDEKKIAELRKQRDPALGCIAVNRFDFIDALFRAYDTEKAAVAQLEPACSSLLARAEKAEEELAQAKSDIHFLTLDAQSELNDAGRVEANLTLEVERLKAIVADPHGVFGAPSLAVVPDPEPTLNAEEVARETGS